MIAMSVFSMMMLAMKVVMQTTMGARVGTTYAGARPLPIVGQVAPNMSAP